VPIESVIQRAVDVRFAYRDVVLTPASGQLTFSVSDHAARNVSKSVSMPAGACCLVFGQVKSSGRMAWLHLLNRRERTLSPSPSAAWLRAVVDDANQRIPLCSRDLVRYLTRRRIICVQFGAVV
jgi:hypothetical protein